MIARNGERLRGFEAEIPGTRAFVADVARRVAPVMIQAGRGAIIAAGNTSALRGKSNFAGFAPSKAADRTLAGSVARELGPKGARVAYVLNDAVVDLEWTRELRPN